jgi:hypothetical protein
MKKILSLVLLTASFNFIHSINLYNRDTNNFPLKRNDQWYICCESKYGAEKCAPFNLEAFKEIHASVEKNEQKSKEIHASAEKNEQKSKELIRDVLITTLKYDFLVLKMFEDCKEQQALSTPEERNASLEEFKKIWSFENKDYSLIPETLDNFGNNTRNPEYVKSLLSEEEQQFHTEVTRMREKRHQIMLKEEYERMAKAKIAKASQTDTKK